MLLHYRATPHLKTISIYSVSYYITDLYPILLNYRNITYLNALPNNLIFPYIAAHYTILKICRTILVLTQCPTVFPPNFRSQQYLPGSHS